MAKLNFQKITKHIVDKVPGLAVGAVGANLLATQVSKMSNGKATPMVVAGAQIVAGAFLPGLLGNSKKDVFFSSVGDGMMAQGAVQLAKALNIPGISGVEEEGIPEDTLAGMFEQENTLAGTNA